MPAFKGSWQSHYHNAQLAFRRHLRGTGQLSCVLESLRSGVRCMHASGRLAVEALYQWSTGSCVYAMLHVSRQGQLVRQVVDCRGHGHRTHTWWRESRFKWPDRAHFALRWLRSKARQTVVEMKALECMWKPHLRWSSQATHMVPHRHWAASEPKAAPFGALQSPPHSRVARMPVSVS